MSQTAPENEFGVSEAAKNRQLAIVTALAFGLLLLLLAVLVYVSVYMSRSGAQSEARELQTLSRIQKVGAVNMQLASAPAAASNTPKTAEEIYNTTCAACHGSGVAGAPKFGDAAEWAPRIAQGEATLFKHAIEGFTGAKGVMPAKGGATALSDDEVKAAVVYMADKGGAHFAAIPLAAGAASAAAPAAAEASAAAPVAEAPAAVVAAAPAATAGADGEKLYKQSCAVCHDAGIAGAPKLGDKADWAPRLAQGEATMFKHAIEGFTGAKGMMPPRGTAMAASDDEIKAAVRYMEEKSK